MKICNSCENEKPIDQFELTGYGYVRNTCSRCRQRKKKPRRLSRIYKMSYQDLLIIKEDQDYKCAICNVHEENVNRGLVIDHNHDTDRVRGWLCHNCNRAIGMLKDDAFVLRRAVAYLERDQEHQE